jgi:hypothetical protein
MTKQSEPIRMDGGPAFPTGEAFDCGKVVAYMEQGMTLRDYFAAKALNGLLSDQRTGSAWSQWDRHEMAAEAYMRADAMLAAREPLPADREGQQGEGRG